MWQVTNNAREESEIHSSGKEDSCRDLGKQSLLCQIGVYLSRWG